MIAEVDFQTYKKFFPADPHPFLSQAFIELNRKKAERVICLAEVTEKPAIGLIAGIRNNRIISPFSAPFGGFHFRNELVYTGEIDHFLQLLKTYVCEMGFEGIDIMIPPDIYHPSFNAKLINSFIRNHYNPGLPEITGWVDLTRFNGSFTQKNSREYYRQALRNKLSFSQAESEKEKMDVYELIRQNREKFGRPIYMTFQDILNTSRLWQADFFKVLSENGEMVASAIFYPFHSEICYAVFWGDNEAGRPLRAMDFLAFQLWTYYREKGYRFLDLGISTESGIPNEGLLRFKESHDSISSAKYRFTWNNQSGDPGRN